MNMLRRLFSKIIPHRSSISMWRKRANTYGKRAVFNIGHSEEELDSITEIQQNEIFPILLNELLGYESTLLDFGCGPGRFTVELANIVKDSRVIGIDPVKRFLDLAPKASAVEYRLMTQAKIPLDAQSVDVVWVCLVLGAIADGALMLKTVSEIRRVMRENALLILVENTSDKIDGEFWYFRNVDYYKSIFNFVNLQCKSEYMDLGERITIMAGRKIEIDK